MEFYDKKIVYLDYLERGNKIKNGGFLKLEVRDTECRAQMNIRGLYPTDTLNGEICVHSKGKEYKVDTILLHYGTGNYVAKWDSENIAGSGVRYEDWDGVSVKISENRVLKNLWNEYSTQEPMIQEPPIQEPPIQEPPIQESPIQESPIQEPPIQEMPIQEVPIQEPPIQEMPVREMSIQEMPKPSVSKEVIKETKPLYEDKWTQLQQMYSTVYPFGDNREYLSIVPRDFVILAEKNQNLVSNSFLLHGYYNYGHVLLGKQEENGASYYFLGVPGIYHEREKQVAVMFGFEGFEGANSPFSEGSFGYYMRRVEI